MRHSRDAAAENVVAVTDSREQLPLNLEPLQTVTGTLSTGDYALEAMPNACAIERKSLDDLLACVGRDRQRFDKEVQRLLAFPTRVLLVESTWPEIEMGAWRSKLTSKQVTGSLRGWIAAGLPIVMAGTHDRAGKFAARILFTVARRRYRELRGLIDQGQ